MTFCWHFNDILVTFWWYWWNSEHLSEILNISGSSNNPLNMNFLMLFFKLTPTKSIWLNTTFLSFNFFTHHIPQPIFFQLKYLVFINFQLNISELGTAQHQLVRNLLLCLSVSPHALYTWEQLAYMAVLSCIHKTAGTRHFYGQIFMRIKLLVQGSFFHSEKTSTFKHPWSTHKILLKYRIDLGKASKR